MASNIPVIVQGNSFSLAIPLQIYYINGDQMDLQDYTPDPTDEVSVQLKGSRRNYTYTPTIDGNVANIDLTGNELADNYGVVVSVVKANGQRLRSFRTDQFFIVESSDDLTPADIIEGLEENVIYLNAQPFIAGADGRGIESIVKTGTSGLVDTYTITYTDSTTSTFNVTNGANGQAGAQGADGVGITSIEKTGTSGLVDTYTITMSNGTTTTFEVTNGKDGVDLGLATIVNNLTTGGTTDVLSAEMGKLIGGVLYGTNENLFDKDDPTNGQISYFGRTLSHKIYISSRTFYAKDIRALLTYNANNTQLTATTSTASSGGGMRKFTIADNVDFAYIRVGYTDTTFVADNENVVNNYYYGNYCEKLFDSIDPKYFNIIDPTAEGFGVDTLYRYTLSNMLFVKDVEVITLKGVAFYEFYDENLTAIRHGQVQSLTEILKIQPSGAYWLRVGCPTIAQLEDSFVALFDITLNVGIPTMGEFVPFVLREINKTSNYNSTKIAVGGDSIAHGYNDNTGLGGWSGRLTTALGAELVSYTYPGAAVCKRTAFPEMSQYSLVERSKQIAQSTDEYSAILLAYGANDFGNATPISPLADVIATSEDEYNFTSALYYSLKRIIDAKPSTNLYIVNILARDGNSPNDANAYNSMLEEVANYFALPILDVRHNCGINPNIPSMATAYMPDKLHPNGAGYEKIAKYIVQSIKEWGL